MVYVIREIYDFDEDFTEYKLSQLYEKIKDIFKQEIKKHIDIDDEWSYKTFDFVAPLIVKKMLQTIVVDSDDDTSYMLTFENEKKLDISLPERHRDEMSICDIMECVMEEFTEIMKFYKVGEFDDYVEDDGKDDDKNEIDVSNWEKNFKSESGCRYYYVLDKYLLEGWKDYENLVFNEYTGLNDTKNEHEKFLLEKVCKLIHEKRLLGYEESYQHNAGLALKLLKEGKMKDECQNNIDTKSKRAKKRRNDIKKLLRAEK
jgi:hypothetical protein